MIETGYVRTMAAYNRWQNDNLFGAADALGDAARRLDRGAFFGSIHATLNHILWADQLWMSRFTGRPKPGAQAIVESTGQYAQWQSLRDARATMDAELQAWAADLDPAWLRADHRWYSGSQQREVSRPRALLVVHMFNHQTHHRGQVHAMLTAAGTRPSDTDLAFMPALAEHAVVVRGEHRRQVGLGEALTQVDLDGARDG